MMSKMLVLTMAVATVAANEKRSVAGAWKWTLADHDMSQCQESVTVDVDGETHAMHTCMGGSTFSAAAGMPRCVHNDDPAVYCNIPKCRNVAGEFVTDNLCAMQTGQNAETFSSGASSSMRDTTLFNGMRGWKDVPNAQFLGFPSTLEWRRGLVPSVRSEADFTMELDCVVGGAGNKCDHFVFVYSCPPCGFANGGGSFVPSLLDAGFVPHRCLTVFDLDKTQDSALHPVIIFHKQTDAGQNDLIQAPELMEFTWYGSSKATTFCPALENEAECDASSECEWQDGSCASNFCPGPRKPRGPWKETPRCQVCPHSPSEEVFLPTLTV